jgi:hypothetical protein
LYFLILVVFVIIVFVILWLSGVCLRFIYPKDYNCLSFPQPPFPPPSPGTSNCPILSVSVSSLNQSLLVLQQGRFLLRCVPGSLFVFRPFVIYSFDDSLHEFVC